MVKLNIRNPFSIGRLIKLNAEETILIREDLQYPGSSNDELYTLKEEESIFAVANEKLGDPRWYWVLWDVNPDIENLFELPIGIDIIIPDLDVIKASLL